MSFVLSAWDKIRKFAKYFDVCQALAEVIEVYKQGKSKLVSIDILKEFRSDNKTHGFQSDPPPHSTALEGDEIEEIPYLTTNRQI